ncbi:MAG: hypothetical protein KDC43_23415, partial [Saprospiraceae bacterium]|nr:hypothetical protein [Saprospiraceae bacterium]
MRKSVITISLKLVLPARQMMWKKTPDRSPALCRIFANFISFSIRNETSNKTFGKREKGPAGLHYIAGM